MAVGTVTLTAYGYPMGMNPYPRRYEIAGLVAIPAGSTYQTNGLPITWGIINAAIGGQDTQPRSALPDTANFKTLSGSTNVYEYDTTNISLRIIVAGAELANGAAIPASVTSDNIEFRGLFQKV